MIQKNSDIGNAMSELRIARQAIMEMQEIAKDERSGRRTEILYKRPSDVPEHVYSLNLARVVIV